MEPSESAFVLLLFLFFEVIDLHRYRCYLHVASQSLNLSRHYSFYRLISIARYVLKSLSTGLRGKKV